MEASGANGSAAGDENDPSTATRESGGTGSQPPDPVPGRSDESFARRLWTAESGPLFFLREVATSAGAVLLVGLLLFGVSGVWPPMVAVESGSMEPHMHKGDLVFITEPGRYTPDVAYGSTGVVTAENGAEAGYRSFGGEGSVVVYDDPGQGGPPIIHRAQFYVESGENWYDRADPEYVSAESCRELLNCPAPHAGFITKGDANGRYDQASGIASPVRSSWITGIARLRIPYLGWVRLGLADVVQGRESTVLATSSRHAVGAGSNVTGTAGVVQAALAPADGANASAPVTADRPAASASPRVSGGTGLAPGEAVATG
ncbi:S26 family signal peptidase [Salinigranum marinum]|uniref:S26 family signal peptidase n=1 Tax=Salinigranum marinum TaxID=1515595 RepID=UPI003CCCED5B